MFDASDRKQVRAREKAAALLDQQRAEVVRNLMATLPGRAWVCDFLEGCHIFATSFTQDPIQTAFNEGERNRGLIVLNDIMSICPDTYIVMMKERSERDAARSGSDRNDGRPRNGNAGPDEDGSGEGELSGDYGEART